MIKFFRKIRQKLLSEGQTGKYLKYAIGEIVLVVIGILIALQINNQNIQKQDDKIEQTYLRSLQNEFKNNLQILDKTISLNNEIINGIDKLSSFFDKKVFDTLSQQTISRYIVQATAEEIYFNPSTGVVTEIISSGNLKLVKNQELKHKLAAFVNKLEFIRHQEEEVLRHRHIVEEMHVQYGNVGRMFSDIGANFEWESRFANTTSFDLFKSKQFENRLFLFSGTSIATNTAFYQPMKDEINAILKIIEKERTD